MDKAKQRNVFIQSGLARALYELVFRDFISRFSTSKCSFWVEMSESGLRYICIEYPYLDNDKVVRKFELLKSETGCLSISIYLSLDENLSQVVEGLFDEVA